MFAVLLNSNPYTDDVIKWEHFRVTSSSSVTTEFPSQRPVMRSFDAFFDMRLNKWSSKQSIRRWFKSKMINNWRQIKSGGIGLKRQGLKGRNRWRASRTKDKVWMGGWWDKLILLDNHEKRLCQNTNIYNNTHIDTKGNETRWKHAEGTITLTSGTPWGPFRCSCLARAYIDTRSDLMFVSWYAAWAHMYISMF